MLLSSAHIPNPFQKLWLFRKWDKGMDSIPEDETFYATQYQEVILKYVENEYCFRHRWLSVIKPERILSNNLFPSTMASGPGQSFFDPQHLSCNEEDYLMPKNMAETTPGCSDCPASLLTGARLNLNSPPESPMNLGQVYTNMNDYHSNPMEISITFWIQDITERWRQQMETHPKYADLSSVACDIFWIISHGVRVEASFSLGWGILAWR